MDRVVDIVLNPSQKGQAPTLVKTVSSIPENWVSNGWFNCKFMYHKKMDFRLIHYR